MLKDTLVRMEKIIQGPGQADSGGVQFSPFRWSSIFLMVLSQSADSELVYFGPARVEDLYQTSTSYKWVTPY